MAEDERDLIGKALERAGSLEGLLEEIVRSEPEELRELQRKVEQGSDHPSHDVLREYASRRVSDKDDKSITEHISLCSVCAHEVFKLQYLEAHDARVLTALIDRIRSFVSDFSFRFVVRPVAEARGSEQTLSGKQVFRPNTRLILTAEAPEDGYVAIFHACEETGKIKLLFPVDPKDNPHLAAGEQLAPITGTVTGPPGKHFFRAFWTRVPMLDPRNSDLKDESVHDEMVSKYFDALENLSENDWSSTTREYEVVVE